MKVTDYKAMIKHSIYNGTKDWGHYITLAQEDGNINFLDFRNIVEYAYFENKKMKGAKSNDRNTY